MARRVKKTIRKIIAGITIFVSVFYGTLFYTLVTLANEQDKVPKPLISQVDDYTDNPGKFYLESIENNIDQIGDFSSTNYENYKEFKTIDKTIVEPTTVLIDEKLYVPFRLLFASGSENYEVELKSKKGIQKISVAKDKLEYSLFEKYSKGFLKLATIEPEFQGRNWKTEPPVVIPTVLPTSNSVEGPLPTISSTPEPTPLENLPEETLEPSPTPSVSNEPQVIPTVLPEPVNEPAPSPAEAIPSPQPESFWNFLINEAQAEEVSSDADWQKIYLTGPTSSSWSIHENYIEIKQVRDFLWDSQNYQAWFKIKLGFDGVSYINNWAFGVDHNKNLPSKLELQLKFKANLFGKIKHTESNGDEVQIDLDKKETDVSKEVIEVDKPIETNEPVSLLNNILGINVANAEEEMNSAPAEEATVTPEPFVDPTVLPEVSLEPETTLAPSPSPEISPTTIPLFTPGEIETTSQTSSTSSSGLVEGSSTSVSEPAVENAVVPEESEDKNNKNETDLSEPPLEKPSFFRQVLKYINKVNPLANSQTVSPKFNFGLGGEGLVNLRFDETENSLTTEVGLKPTEASPSSENITPGNVSTASVVLSNIGSETDETGIWIASGDGSKNTDFKMHFSRDVGGAIDQLYLGEDFVTNKVGKPQSGSGGLTLIEQDEFSQTATRSIDLEIIEKSKVRIVVRNTFTLGEKATVEEIYAVYANGRIIKSITYDKKDAGEERWYLNANKAGFDLPVGYEYSHLILNTNLETNSKDLVLVWQDDSIFASSSFEAKESEDSYITVAKMNRMPWTYVYHQMIDLMQEDLSMVNKTSIDERVADYRHPDNPRFSLGEFMGFNKQFGSYEMKSAGHENHVIFTMDGSNIPRFQPIFEIHNWYNPDLSSVKSYLNKRDMIENRDYIADFVNGDPGTGTLVFHFLGTVRTNSEFTADGFGVFDIDPEVAPGGGIFIWTDGNRLSQRTLTTDSTGIVTGAGSSISSGANTNGVRTIVRSNPVGSALASGSDNEYLNARLTGGGILEMYRWDGTTWTLDWSENSVGSQSLDFQAYDVAYQSNGHAIVAWSKTNDETGLIEYRAWNGTSWLASSSFTVTTKSESTTSEEILWVNMVSHPATGSNQNEVALCYVNSGPSSSTGTGVGCAVWNGDTQTWGNNAWTESNAEEGALFAGDSNAVTVFYEQSSGKLVEISGIEHSGSVNGGGVVLTYSSWNGSSWTATASFTSGSGTGDSASLLYCSPASFYLNNTTTKNKAMCLAYENSARDSWSFIWDGSVPNNENANIFIANSAFDEAHAVTADWIVDTTPIGLAVMATVGGASNIRYTYWDDNSSTWTTQKAAVFQGGNNVFLASNPYQKNNAMLIMSSSGNMNFGEASVSGTTVTFHTPNTIVTSETPGNATLGAMAAFDLFDNPTQTHYQWLNDDASLGSATAFGSQDNKPTGLTNGTNKRLRVQISNEGSATNSYNFQLEFAKKGASCAEAGLSGGWRYREIHTDAVVASDAFDIELTNNFANGNATAASLSASDPTFVSGQGIESASSTSAIILTGNNYTEIEYSLVANSNAQSNTDYCFRITDGGSSTSFTYTNYAQVQTGTIAQTPPTYTQDYFRFYVNVDSLTPTDVWPIGGDDLAENSTLSAQFGNVASGSITRLRTNILISTATLNVSSQTFQLQYAEGLDCGAISNGVWSAVGASTSNSIWRFGSNTSVADGTTLASPVLLSNSTDGARGTYEEANPSAVNPNVVSSGQRMEHDWSVQNNGATTGAAYCFRIIRTSGTVLEAYNRFPLVILAPSTDQTMRHGTFFSEGRKQPYFWSGI